jgi:phage terminase large subunit-like protein
MAKWRNAEAAFDMLQFGLRLGSQPRQLITTTPRPTALLRGSAARSSTARSSRTGRTRCGRALLENCRVAEAPNLQRIVVAVDPPASSSKRADACGIVAAGTLQSRGSPRIRML